MIDKQTAIKNGITVIDSAEGKNALYECLKANFPQTIKENQVDLNAIATLLGLNANLTNKQHYELIFTGKALANALYDSPCEKAITLQETFSPSSQTQKSPAITNGLETAEKSPSLAEGDLGGGLLKNAENSQNPTTCHSEPAKAGEESQKNSQNSAIPLNLNTNSKETPQNSLIIGDNLDALKILKSAYTAQIKMIYIDPPYNTQSENFIYPDNFRNDYKDILREVGLLEVSEDGTEIESQTLKYFKNIQSTRTHSGWLAFMLPRLKLARDLLREDGVIFISIDDNEQANLRLLCDEIFGEDNFVYQLSVVDKLNGNDNSSGMMETQEYCLVYAKDKNEFEMGVLPIDDEAEQKDWKQDELGWWKEGGSLKATGEASSREARPNLFFPIYIDEQNLTFSLEKDEKHTYELLPLTNGAEMRWYWSKKRFLDDCDEVIVKKTNGGYSLYKKQRPALGDLPSKRGKTTFYSPKYSTANSDAEIKKLFGAKVFPYSKSKDLIKDLICLSNSNSNDLILDFFAGSGTTAHAVMDLNAQDKGNRKFILVQLDENKQKTAFDFCKNELKSETPLISDITAERLRRVATKLANTNGANQKSPSPAVLGAGYKNAENPQTLSFNIYKLAPKPKLISEDLNSLFLTANEDLSGFDKALNLALQSGKRLDEPLEIIIPNKLYKCKDSYFCIEFSDKVLELLSKTKDEYIIIDGFSNIDLQSFLNANVRFNDRLRVVY